MARNFLLVGQDDVDLRLAKNIHSRELELASYDFEVANHEAAIAALGNLQWTKELLRYRNMARDVMIARAISDGLDSATIQLISDLNALDQHRHNLEAVKSEIAKSERHYGKLLESLPEGQRRESAFVAFEADKAKQSEKPVK